MFRLLLCLRLPSSLDFLNYRWKGILFLRRIFSFAPPPQDDACTLRPRQISLTSNTMYFLSNLTLSFFTGECFTPVNLWRIESIFQKVIMLLITAVFKSCKTQEQFHIWEAGETYWFSVIYSTKNVDNIFEDFLPLYGKKAFVPGLINNILCLRAKGLGKYAGNQITLSTVKVQIANV